jgi:hypothetical protein
MMLSAAGLIAIMWVQATGQALSGFPNNEAAGAAAIILGYMPEAGQVTPFLKNTPTS